MTTRIWNLTLTPDDGSRETYRGLSTDDATTVVRSLVDGVPASDIDVLHRGTAAHTDEALAA